VFLFIYSAFGRFFLCARNLNFCLNFRDFKNLKVFPLLYISSTQAGIVLTQDFLTSKGKT